MPPKVKDQKRASLGGQHTGPDTPSAPTSSSHKRINSDETPSSAAGKRQKGKKSSSSPRIEQDDRKLSSDSDGDEWVPGSKRRSSKVKGKAPSRRQSQRDLDDNESNPEMIEDEEAGKDSGDEEESERPGRTCKNCHCDEENLEEFLKKFLPLALTKQPEQKSTKFKKLWEADPVRPLKAKTCVAKDIKYIFKKAAGGEKHDANIIPAVLAHRLGTEKDDKERCLYCALNISYPAFSECVFYQDLFDGGCTCCKYRHDNTNCTLKSEGIPFETSLRPSRDGVNILKNYTIENISNWRYNWTMGLKDNKHESFCQDILHRHQEVFKFTSFKTTSLEGETYAETEPDHEMTQRYLGGIPWSGCQREFSGDVGKLIQKVKEGVQKLGPEPRDRFRHLMGTNESVLKLMETFQAERCGTWKSLIRHPFYLCFAVDKRKEVRKSVWLYFNIRYTKAIEKILGRELVEGEDQKPWDQKTKYLWLKDDGARSSFQNDANRRLREIRKTNVAERNLDAGLQCLVDREGDSATVGTEKMADPIPPLLDNATAKRKARIDAKLVAAAADLAEQHQESGVIETDTMVQDAD